MPVKKPAKKTAVVVVAKPAPKPVAKPAPAAKVARVAKKVVEVSKPELVHSYSKKDINAKTGFSRGTNSDIIAIELLKGGKSRADVAKRVADIIPNKTKNGTAKPFTHIVANTLYRMIESGKFEVVSTYKVRKTR